MRCRRNIASLSLSSDLVLRIKDFYFGLDDPAYARDMYTVYHRFRGRRLVCVCFWTMALGGSKLKHTKRLPRNR